MAALVRALQARFVHGPGKLWSALEKFLCKITGASEWRQSVTWPVLALLSVLLHGRPRSHYGRCPYKSCRCCRAHYAKDANKGCQECYAGWTLTTLSKFFRKVTNLQAWRTCSCRCGGCAASWIKAGWDCRVRCGNEWSDVIEKNSFWEIAVSRAEAHT